MTVWFDVEDLLRHREEGNLRVTGIQRLTLEIYRAAQGLGGVGFVRHGTGPHLLHLVPGNELIGLFDEQPATAPGVRRPPAALPVPPEQPRTARQTLRAAIDLQSRSWSGVGEFGVGVATHLASGVRRRTGRRGGPRAQPGRFEALVQPGDTLLVLGSPWFQRDYSRFARWARDERRMRFGVLVCDLVPLRHPEWCDLSLRRAFADWYRDVLPFCDLVLAISRYTARDVEAFAREIGVALPRPVRSIPIGSGFAGDRPVGRPGARPGDYVLFVSTIEARKNHALLVEVWRRLLAERRDGVPELVFAGKIGWLVADLVAQLDATGWLRGQIRLVASPTDAALRDLYAGAMFTVFPSLFEGWGLPVTESLAFGVPCLCSDAASLPEAGGDLCRYFDPENVGAAHQMVAGLLDDRPGLEAWRARVRREFQPTPWSDAANAVLDEANAA